MAIFLVARRMTWQQLKRIKVSYYRLVRVLSKQGDGCAQIRCKASFCFRILAKVI